MSIWSNVRGHATQVEMYRAALTRNRFSQAYLFVGPDGCGKRLFAHTLAQCLLCETHPDKLLEACGQCSACKQVQSCVHPDVLTAAPPKGKSIFPIDVIAGGKENRGRSGLCYDITLRPMSASCRIAIVDDVHLMNVEAANAFLKTLEEPPDYAHLFLITSNEDALLPTIRSRCQQVRFFPLPPADVSGLLLEQELLTDAAEADAVAALSEGGLTTAKQLLDPGLRSLRETLYNGLSGDRDEPFALAKRLLDGLADISGDSQETRRNAGWLVRFALNFFSLALQQLAAGVTAPVPQVHRFASKFDGGSVMDIELMMSLADRTAEAEQQLRRNLPPQMCLENLFHDLGCAMRSHRDAIAAG